MILIVSLNFGIERIVRLVSEEAGIETPPAIVRGALEARHASAKGINAARALLRLNYPALVVGLIGGWPGHFIVQDLNKEGIQFVPVAIHGENRTCVVLRKSSGESLLVMNECGPEISAEELHQIDETYQQYIDSAELILLTGSLLPGIPDDFYARLIRLAQKANKRVLLDAAGKPLAEAQKALPFGIKINAQEAAAFTGQPILNLQAAADAAHWMVKQGSSIAMITLGAAGAVLCTPEERYAYTVPIIRSHNSVGAGDATLAGLSLALLQGRSAKDAGLFACAVGTAATLHGAGRCVPDDVREFLGQVHCLAF